MLTALYLNPKSTVCQSTKMFNNHVNSTVFKPQNLPSVNRPRCLTIMLTTLQKSTGQQSKDINQGVNHYEPYTSFINQDINQDVNKPPKSTACQSTKSINQDINQDVKHYAPLKQHQNNFMKHFYRSF